MDTERIVSMQQAWAASCNLKCIGTGPATVAENLFHPMHSATIAEFANGDAAELETNSKPGKMRSLRSSSALAVNMFDRWRYRPLAPLVAALGFTGEFVEFRFEQKFPTGLQGKRPNIDVVFFPQHGAPVGVECKFCEPYDAKKERPPIDGAYFPSGQGLWANAGLNRSQLAAAGLGHSHTYLHLDAAQLLKHILGLGHTYPGLRPVQLIYLWFDSASRAAQNHRSEIEAFARRVEDTNEVSFRSLTYQEVFARLRITAGTDQEYLSQLESRYFAST